MSQFRYVCSALTVACLVPLTACRSRVVDVTIVNQGPAVHLMEFDYPSASFGLNELASGGRYQYRIQVQGPGAVTLQYEDAGGRKTTSTGPKVDRGDQGSLSIQISQAGAITWNPGLTKSK